MMDSAVSYLLIAHASLAIMAGMYQTLRWLGIGAASRFEFLKIGFATTLIVPLFSVSGSSRWLQYSDFVCAAALSVYFGIAIYLLTRVFYQWWRIHKISAQSTGTSFLGSIPILMHHHDLPPATIGMISPKILVNERTWEALTDEERSLVQSHEQVHIERSDYFFLLIAHVLRALLFVSPLSWWLLRRWEEDMELSCDALVLNQGVSARAYGSLLVDLSTGRHSRTSLASGLYISQSFLSRRISAMRVYGKVKPSRAVGFVSAFLLATSTLALGSTLPPQGSELAEEVILTLTHEFHTEDGREFEEAVEVVVEPGQEISYEMDEFKITARVLLKEKGDVALELTTILDKEGKEEELVFEYLTKFGAQTEIEDEFEGLAIGITYMKLNFIIDQI